MINQMHYEVERGGMSFLIVSPHSSPGDRFFEYFPELKQHPDWKAKEQILRTYLRIEQDYGAKELACAIASQLKEQGYGSTVCELEYPRGLIDGGRVLNHCLRGPLTESINATYRDRWLELHEKSLIQLDELYDRLNQNQGLLLDIHTMASFSPMAQGKEITTSVSYNNIESYNQQFINAPKNAGNLRKLDLISSDDEGQIIGYNPLRLALIDELNEAGITFDENHPYAAPPAFLMNRHMNQTKGIAIDVPKHMVAVGLHPEDLVLDNFELDHHKIEGLARLIAKAAATSLEEQKRVP